MASERPFSGPVSVTLAALTIVALGAASFASGLSHQLRLSRREIPAQLAFAQAKPAPKPPVPALALAVAPPSQEAAPEPPARKRRRARPRQIVPTLPTIAPASPGPVEAAPAEGMDAVAAAPPDETPPADSPSPDETPSP